MANFRRRRPSTRTPAKTYYKWTAKKNERQLGSWFWLGSWPAWHDILYHRRPSRRATRAIEHAIVHDRIDADEALWPLSKRPHVYYW